MYQCFYERDAPEYWHNGQDPILKTQTKQFYWLKSLKFAQQSALPR
jgi:hypothetical protein